jgi:hypothetical protein
MLENRYKLRRDAVAWQQVDGETVLLDLVSSTYLGANRTGSALWTLLAEGATQSELVDQLCAEFGAERGRAEADVDTFLQSCRDRGFLDR